VRASARLAAPLAIALVAGGCGGGGGTGVHKALSDPVAVRAAVAGFATAFGAGDGAKSCDLLTPAARAAFVKRVQKLVRSTDCATAMKRLHDDAGAQVTSAFTTAQVGAVKVAGNIATVELTAAGHSTTVHLVKQGGDWKLAGLPGA
jgi:hypothetical protein